MGAGIVLSALAGSLESISQAVLPCPALIQREVLDLMVAGYAVLTHGRPASFWANMEEGYIEGGVERWGKEKRKQKKKI